MLVVGTHGVSGETIMFHNASKALSLAVVAGVLLLAVGPVASQEKGQIATIAGMLYGTDEDSNGNPTRVFLQDDNLGDILVADDEKGAELVAHAGTQVKITGTLVDTEGDYDLMIYVDTWSPLPDNQPDTIDPE